MESLFCCPICGEGLRREPGRYACPGGHSFDVAKEGYVNLLPANRQHSKAPGDDKEMAAARSQFLEGGWYGPLRETLCALVEKYGRQAPVLLDAGCGEGWYTSALGETVLARGGRIAGVDLSKPGVKRAARRQSRALQYGSYRNVLLTNRCLNVVMVGGPITPQTNAVLGSMAERTLRSMQADKCFMGINGIYPEGFYMASSFLEMSTKQAILEASRQKFVLADHTKFGQSSFLKVEGLTEGTDGLITDKRLEDFDYSVLEKKTNLEFAE